MIDLMQVYICPEHGEILSDQTHTVEEVDTENDEVYIHRVHDECYKDVTPKMENGIPYFQTVDHERWLWANGYYDYETGIER